MATGDILSCTIRPDGWTADVVIEGFSLGATYDFGYAAGNIPTASTPYLDVVSEGYDATAQLGTISRRVYLTAVVRKPYPDHTDVVETEDGGNLTVRVALSDYVYDDDKDGGEGTSGTNPTLTAPAGWVTNAGGSNEPSAAAENLVCVNNSAADYPKVIGRWAWPGFDRVTDAITAERVAFHRFGRSGKPVACVVFEATDGSTTVSATITAMTKPTRGDISVGVYEATIDVTSLSEGVITVNATAYPWVGDADSIQTSVGGAAQPALTDGPLKWLKGGEESIAYVDAVSGNNGTGVVSTDPATASSSPYQTIAAAVNAIATANTVNSRDGGRVRLKAGSHTIGHATSATTNTWLIIEADPDAGSTPVINDSTSASGAVISTSKLKLSGVAIDSTNATNRVMLNGDAAWALWLHNCRTERAAGITDPIIFDYGVIYATGCTAVRSGIGTFSSRNRAALHRGNTLEAGAVIGQSACAIGNTTSDGNSMVGPSESHQDNGVCYGNRIYDFASVSSAAASFTIALTHGFAFIGNIIEASSGTNRLLSVYADGNTLSAANVLFWHNTVAGERCNLGYASSDDVVFENWSVKHNAMQWWPCKHDIFHQDGSIIGGWAVMYEVGCSGNHSELWGPGNYDLARVGLRSTYASGADAPAGYIDDASVFGTGLGNGDYTPAEGSILLAKIPAGEAVVPYDVFGNPVPDDGTGAAGAVQRVSDDPDPPTATGLPSRKFIVRPCVRPVMYPCVWPCVGG